MKRSSYRTLLTAIVVFMLTTVCNLPSGRPITSSPTDTVILVTATPSDYLIPPTTKVMDTEVQSALESVSDEGVITFSHSTPALEALAAGDVLVSDVVPAAPYGLLRKVKTIRNEGVKVIVETEDAELIEAVHDGRVSFTKDLKPEDVKTTWLYPGVTFNEPGDTARNPGLAAPAKAYRPNTFSYSINTDFGTGGRIKAIGNASLEPKLEADVNISCNDKVFGVCAEIPDLNFMTRIAILENVSLSVQGNATNFNKRVVIAKHEFTPLTFWIGPVPVVFTPILSVYLQGDGLLTSKLEYAIGQKLTLAAGFKYNSDSGWEDLSEASFDFLKPTPTFTDRVELRGVIGGEFELLLYGAIGPYANLEAGPYFRANLSGLPDDPGALWKAEGCIWLNVGIDSKKVIKLRYQKELYKNCATFAEGRNQPPSVSIQSPNQGTQVYQGDPLKLRATVFDPDGSALNCKWTSNQGGDPFPISDCEKATVTFNTPGTRTLTLKATDSAGLSANASVSFEVLPPPNILVSIVNPLDGGTVGPDEIVTLAATTSGGQEPYNLSWAFSFPTDASGNGGTQYNVGSGNGISWAPSNSVTFNGCEVNGFGKLTLTVQDANGFSGSRSIVILVSRIC